MNDLTSVAVETFLGASYVFPDVPRSMVQTVALESTWQTLGTFVLVNVSGASLSVPARIIKTISWDGEVRVTRDGP